MRSTHLLEIERPERWAKQLLSHLANKSTLEGDTLTFGFGARGTVVPTFVGVFLVAEADTKEALERAQDVLAKHLYRFAKIDYEVEKVKWVLLGSEE